MGFVITATNNRGATSTFWVPVSMIRQAYDSFDLQWDIACSKLLSRKPRGIDHHIKERL